MSDEISIEKVMEILELPLETVFKLSQAKTPEAQQVELAEVKARVLKQNRKLQEKYSTFKGTVVGNKQICLIAQAVSIIMTLEVAKDLPKDGMIIL